VSPKIIVVRIFEILEQFASLNQSTGRVFLKPKLQYALLYNTWVESRQRPGL
jgi:hypothetical protein